MIKKLFLAFSLLAIFSAGASAAPALRKVICPECPICPETLGAGNPYFLTIFADPTHPKLSMTALFTSKMDFDGAITDAAIIYHKAGDHDPLWPQTFTDWGFAPLSYSLLDLGAGGNQHTAFGHVGVSLNAAPTLLGPAVSLLRRAGGNYATFGNLLVNPDGSGLRVSFGWKADVIEEGGFVQANHIRFPPRYGFGYNYQF